MAVTFIKSREKDASPELLVAEAIRLGIEHMKVEESALFYRNLRLNKRIADTIRNCNNMLGMGGNFKNGCLYREYGLEAKWNKNIGELVVCDHSVPITELVRQHLVDGEPIENLILSPVVRITSESNRALTTKGFAKKGIKAGFPLFRYSRIGMRILTHTDVEINPETWSDEDHWSLVLETKELHPVLEHLKLWPQ